MSLDKKVYEVTQSFGEALKATFAVKKYTQAQNALEAEKEIYEKEERMQVLYLDLATRQQAGESLSHKEIASFNALRSEVLANNLVKARDEALAEVKSLFADAASILSTSLGVEYTDLIIS